MRITEIKWDAPENVLDTLPTEVEVDVEEDDAADYLSDTYGYCVYGFGVDRTELYREKKPFGAFTLTNTLGLLFYNPEYCEDCDYIVMEAGVENPQVRQVRVEYDDKGENYVRYDELVVPLSQVMLVR